MLGYYLDLARRSLRRNRALTVLMIVAIAFGVGASMTMLTVLRVLSADPIAGKSEQLFYVQLDPYSAEGYIPGEEPALQMTRLDAEAIVRAKQADRAALMTGGNAAVEPVRAGLDPFFVEARWTSAGIFELFDIPFLAGTGWSEADDASNARVIVIGKELAMKALGSTAVVGQNLRIDGTEMRIVGVIDTWRPTPHFYDLNTGSYAKAEQVFMPFSTSRELKLARNGSMSCWGDSPDPEALTASCEWIQLWVQLDTPAKAARFREYLVTYSREQKAAGRYEREPNVRLRNVREWLAFRKVVPDDAKLQTWVALGFLLVCLINTVGLLLTKFLRRSQEIGVRRALGASKRSVFVQLLVEAGVIGFVGGLFGLALAWLGLWAVRHQPTQYADLARMDLAMLGATFGLAILASLLAGLLPAWRGCQVTPAIQLKSL